MSSVFPYPKLSGNRRFHFDPGNVALSRSSPAAGCGCGDLPEPGQFIPKWKLAGSGDQRPQRPEVVETEGIYPGGRKLSCNSVWGRCGGGHREQALRIFP